jgi:hypothetical protein
MAALLDTGVLAGGDGSFRPGADRLCAPGDAVPYRLTEDGAARLGELGVDTPAPRRGERPLVRYCVDWSEQRHHLSGALGAAILRRLLELGWLERAPAGRAVRVTEAGSTGLWNAFGIEPVSRLPTTRARTRSAPPRRPSVARLR